MIQIFIENTDTDDLFATVNDLNTLPPSVPMNNQRINAGNRAPTSVQEDGNGNCLVRIVTVKADDPTKTKTFDNQACGAGGVIQVDVFGV